MQFPNSRIVVFCKAPVPGKVKTRLAMSIGNERAAAIHMQMAEHILRVAVSSQIAPVELWCAPSTQHPFFKSCQQKYKVKLRDQGVGDLGDRMARAFSGLLDERNSVVVIGTDCPMIDSAYLCEAFEMLESHGNPVIGPAEDGGYVLIGLKRVQPGIFKDISWGTSQVFAQTIKQIAGEWFALPELWDIDNHKDLSRLCKEYPGLVADCDMHAWS